MCRNGTRRLTFSNIEDAEFGPILFRDKIMDLEEQISIEFHLEHITSPTQYQIFDALESNNVSMTLSLIEAHIGINAVDQWGQNPLIIAVAKNSITIISTLLNAFDPKIDINYAKSVSTTHIYLIQFYLFNLNFSLDSIH